MPPRSSAVVPCTLTNPVQTLDYPSLVQEIKERIYAARVRAALAVNTEVIMLYWELGHAILVQQQRDGWGSHVVIRLATDLRVEFPDMTGLSRRNLQYMRAFADAYQDANVVRNVFARVPWRHNMVLLDKLDTIDARLWYAQQTVAHGWTRELLVHHIATDLCQRQGSAITSFHQTLSAPLAALAQQMTRDPIVFELPGWTGTDVPDERTLERALVDRVRDLLLSLGENLAFLGHQYHVSYDGQDYYIDLAFYATRLHSYVAIELKRDDFRPEYLGQLNFYVELMDEVVRDKTVDAPSIGILVCRSKRQLTVELALRTTTKPIAVSSYSINARQALVDKISAGLSDLLVADTPAEHVTGDQERL